MAVLELRREGPIGIITIDEPPVNVLSVTVRKALLEGFAAMRADSEVEAIVLSCGGRTFIAGFDISEFRGGLQEPHLNLVLEAVENVGKPTVAAIHGAALGGGFELSLLCSHRIAVPSAAVGLPEVKIGLMPGAGGTQRLPRAVGPELALELILTGRSVGGIEALELGLVDCLAEEGQLERDAIAFACRIVQAGGPLPRIGDRQDLVEPYRGKPEFFAACRERQAAEFRGFNAHEAIIAAVEAAVELPILEGLQREQQLCNALAVTRESRAQRHAFFAERLAAKVTSLPFSSLTRRIASIGILGEGEAAEAAALCFSGCRLPVKKLDLADSSASSAGLIVATGAGGVPVGIPGDTIVVLTDGLAGLDEIAATTSAPGNVVGLHIHPAGRRLAEVVFGKRSDPKVVAALVDLLRRSGKVPVLCRPSPGLIAGRLLTVLRNQVGQLQAEGVAAAAIDAALYDYGFKPGLLCGEADAVSNEQQQTVSGSILKQLLDPVVNEGARLIADGTALRASDIDIAAIHGLEWPIFTGGPMFWAEAEGWMKTPGE